MIARKSTYMLVARLINGTRLVHTAVKDCSHSGGGASSDCSDLLYHELYVCGDSQFVELSLCFGKCKSIYLSVCLSARLIFSNTFPMADI